MQNAKLSKRILLIYTGGTIGMEKDYKNQVLRPFDFENLLNHIPELEQINAEIGIKSFETPIDSSDVAPHHWQTLARLIEENYHSYDGFVILHGTDTMAFTASALSFVIQGLQKPVIFTGSQLPIGDLRTDARENLISSVHYAALTNARGEPVIREVCLYFEYKLYRANRTTKVNADNFDAFRSPNYPALGESGVKLNIFSEYLWRPLKTEFSIQPDFSDSVGLIKIFPGMNLQFLVDSVSNPAINVLILEAYGAGNISQQPELAAALEKRTQNGLHLIITTQCAGGSVELGKYSTSQVLQQMNAISGSDLTTEAAVTKAMWLMANLEDKDRFAAAFTKNLKGECAH